HLGVGDRGRDVVGIQTPIEAHAFGELFDSGVGRLLKNTTPGLLCHAHPSQAPKEWAAKHRKLRQPIHCKWLRKSSQRAPRLLGVCATAFPAFSRGRARGLAPACSSSADCEGPGTASAAPREGGLFSACRGDCLAPVAATVCEPWSCRGRMTP